MRDRERKDVDNKQLGKLDDINRNIVKQFDFMVQRGF
jgi:hypothetical protein